MNAIDLITTERQRQIEDENYSQEHDDEHINGELAQAASCYAWPAPRPIVVKKAWPWALEDWKPELFGVGADDDEKRAARIRVLIKAGALLAAEIDRLLRLNNDR